MINSFAVQKEILGVLRVLSSFESDVLMPYKDKTKSRYSILNTAIWLAIHWRRNSFHSNITLLSLLSTRAYTHEISDTTSVHAWTSSSTGPYVSIPEHMEHLCREN